MTRRLTLIGAPSSAGAYAPGQEKAPAAFRRAGLVPALEAMSLIVTDCGDGPIFRWHPDPVDPQAMNLAAVRDAARRVADHAAVAFAAGDRVLVLGGDCTLELGTVAGALRDGASVGLVYIDLDTDLNSPAQSDGALDWTGVAHLLDLPGTAPELSGLGPRRPLLEPGDLLYFGADNIEAHEAAVIAERGLARIGLAEVRAHPRAAAERAAHWGRGFDRLLVHLDADVLSFTAFPIAENVRRRDGLTFEELAITLRVLVGAPNWSGLTLAEFNPDHAPEETESFAAIVAMLAASLAP